MTLFLVGLGMVTALGLWMYSRGRKDKEADQMQRINDDAYKATKLREQVEAMGSDGVRNALRLRRSKR
tara:strand:- start:2971 stop:3174 length:204 start_codon:yes stop_codon:yes gene_type:complete